MDRTFCPRCSFDHTGCSECPYCADLGPPIVAGDNVEPAKTQIGMIILSGLLIVLTLALATAIGRGQEPCPPQPQRVEYYTTDDGKQVPIINGQITVYHAYTRQQPQATVYRTPVAPTFTRTAYRPEVRQSPFPFTTPIINARIAGGVSTPLAAISARANIRIPANTAERRGDTNPP
jgi:hypothetical protein